MNKARRKELNKALDMIIKAAGIIEACRDDEQDAYDNLPDGIQMSDRGEIMEENIDQMEDAVEQVEYIADVLYSVIEG